MSYKILRYPQNYEETKKLAEEDLLALALGASNALSICKQFREALKDECPDLVAYPYDIAVVRWDDGTYSIKGMEKNPEQALAKIIVRLDKNGSREIESYFHYLVFDEDPIIIGQYDPKNDHIRFKSPELKEGKEFVREMDTEEFQYLILEEMLALPREMMKPELAIAMLESWEQINNKKKEAQDAGKEV